MPQSKANTGYKATFGIGDSASPIDYTVMAELASIKPSNFSIPAIDTTHLQSPNATEEMIPGLIKPGTIALSGNFTGDTSQLNISQLAQTQSVFPWKITSPINKARRCTRQSGLASSPNTRPGRSNRTRRSTSPQTFRSPATSRRRWSKPMVRKIADKLVQKVEILLDGKTWPIVITHNILIECEDLTGLNVLSGDANLVRPSAKLMRALLFLALQRAGAKYTIEEVGDFITPHNLVTIQRGILAAWAAALPAPDEVKGDPADPTKAAE